MFQEPEFVSGFKMPVTLQPLNKSKVRGWFLKSDDMADCKWTATEADFEKGSVIFDYVHTFGRKPNLREQTGLNFIQPNIQFLWKGPLAVEQRRQDSDHLTIGTLDEDHVKEAFEADKLAAAQDPKYDRMYQVRTKYLINILTKDFKPAHEVPIILTVKALNGMNLSVMTKNWEGEISKALNALEDNAVPKTYTEQVLACFVFQPSLAYAMEGEYDTEICAIESFNIPDYSDQETAFESLSKMAIPDDDRQKTWDTMVTYKDFLPEHYEMDAKKLGGKYGLAPGVKLLPQGIEGKSNVAIPASAERDSVGADAGF